MDKYAQAFADAMEVTGMRNTTVASYLGGAIVPANVSHWRTGRRGIPKEHAPAVGILLSVPPESISKAYDQQLRAAEAMTTMAAHGARTGVVAEGYVALERMSGFGQGEGSDRLVLPELLVRRELGATAIEHVRWVLQQSRSMEPEIRRHALLLIDISARQPQNIVDGGLYAVRLWDHTDIRRVQRRRDGWTLATNSEDSERMHIGAKDSQNFAVLGAVVGWL